MQNSLRTKLVSDTDLDDGAVEVRPPFKLERDEQRRFVRLELSVSMSLTRIRDAGGGFWPSGERVSLTGTVLNVSAGGVLAELNDPLNEGDLVAMRFTLQDDIFHAIFGT